MVISKKEFTGTGVYMIINMISGRDYIGSTTMQFYKRLQHHISELRRGTHKNNYLQNAWNKYVEENFEVKIVEYVDVCCTLDREQLCIDTYFNNYNINPLYLSVRFKYEFFREVELKQRFRGVVINKEK